MSIKILELQKKEKLMLNLLLFLLTFSSVYSQNLEFEEVLDFDPSGLSNAQYATLSLKGDSAFFHVELDTASPYVDYINNFYFSSNNGKTWENVTENFQKILFGDHQFLSGQFFHQKLFMFIHKFSEGNDLYIGYYDVKGNLINKIKIDPEYRYWRIILNHINEDFIGLYARYFHDTDHNYYQHYFDYSTDRGKTWHKVHPEKLGPSCEIDFRLNIRNSEIGMFTFIDYNSNRPKLDISIFKYNFYDKTYDYSYQIAPYESKDYGFREEDYILDKYQSNIKPLLDLSKTEIVDTISSYSITNMPQDSLNNLNNNDYEEKVYIYGFFKYLEKEYGDYNFSNFRFNLEKPDTFLCKIIHFARKRINGKIETLFSRSLIFSSYNGGISYNFLTELSTRNVFLNPINNEIWSISYLDDNIFKLYKSKNDIFSSVSLEKKYKLNVYFSGNNLIIENDEEPKESTIKIFDLGGRAILQKDILLQKGTNQIPLSSHINPNLYLVNIELTNSKINIYKLIKGE